MWESFLVLLSSSISLYALHKLHDDSVLHSPLSYTHSTVHWFSFIFIITILWLFFFILFGFWVFFYVSCLHAGLYVSFDCKGFCVSSYISHCYTKYNINIPPPCTHHHHHHHHHSVGDHGPSGKICFVLLWSMDAGFRKEFRSSFGDRQDDLFVWAYIKNGAGRILNFHADVFQQHFIVVFSWQCSLNW